MKINEEVIEYFINALEEADDNDLFMFLTEFFKELEITDDIMESADSALYAYKAGVAEVDLED